MESQDNRSLLDTLREVAGLPDYMRANATNNVVAEWRRRSPLVEEVVNGNATFEDAVSALVEENSRLRFLRNNSCNSSHFEEVAKETDQKLDGIMPLTGWSWKPRSMTLLDLREPVSVVRQLLWSLKFNVGTGLGTMLVMLALASYFIDPKLFADYWYWAIGIGVGFGLLLATGQLLIGYPGYLAERRQLADTTKRRAQFLDSMLKPQQA